MINSIFHRGGEVCAWEQTKFDLIIEFQLLTKFSIHSSTASWLNWIIDLRRGRGGWSTQYFQGHKTSPSTNHFELLSIVSLSIYIDWCTQWAQWIFKFIIQSWLQSWFQLVLSNCFFLHVNTFSPLDASLTHPAGTGLRWRIDLLKMSHLAIPRCASIILFLHFSVLQYSWRTMQN